MRGIKQRNVLKGVAFGFSTAIFHALDAVVLRSMPKNQIHAETNTFYYYLISCLIGVFGISTSRVMSIGDLVRCLFIGVLYYMATTLKGTAYQNAQIFIVQIAGASRLVFGILFDAVFFQTFPNVWSVVGALLVLLSVSLVAYRKTFSKKEDNDETMKET